MKILSLENQKNILIADMIDSIKDYIGLIKKPKNLVITSTHKFNIILGILYKKHSNNL